MKSGIRGFIRRAGRGWALAHLLSAFSGHATPQSIRIDGAIFDASGLPLTVSRDLQVKAYDVATGGTALWTSNTSIATMDNGRFTIHLDPTTGSPSLVQRLADLPAGGAIYFEIIYDAGTANGTMNTPRIVRPRIRPKGAMFAVAAGTTDALRMVPVSTATPASGQVLGYDGASWAPTSVTAVVSGAYVAKSGDTMSGNLTALGLTLTGVSANSTLVTDGAQNVVSSGVSGTEFGYLAGVTGNIQTQLNAKLSNSNMVARTGDTMSGNLQTTALNVTGLTPNTALITDASKNVISSGVSSTELGYLAGVSAAIQTQLDAKLTPYPSQSAGVVLAGPTSGSATPSFRALANSDLPVMVGDSGSGGTAGAVPAPAAGDAAALKFLKANGGWAQPSYFGQSCSAGNYLSGYDVAGAPVCVSLPSNTTYSKISAGYIFQCALLSDTTLQCWGSGGNGQLGWGTTASSTVPVYVRALDGSKFSGATEIASGYQTACALKADGTVWCWGYNGYGCTGNGNTTTPQLAPTQVLNVSSATQISGAQYQFCARISNGTIKCWGYNGNYQLGDGTTNNASTPVQVAGITSAVHVSIGTYAACAVLADGTAKCWGYNGYGELGDGTVTQRTTPTTVINYAGGGGSALTGITSISASRSNNSYYGHSCAVKSNGTVYCWGSGANGQLGTGTNLYSYTPVQVAGVTNAVKVRATSPFTCIMTADGLMKCTGYNGAGNLGDNTVTQRYTMVTVLNSAGTGSLTNVTDISTHDGASASNYMSSCVAGGRAYTWGDNTTGAFGNNNTTASYLPRGAYGP